MSEQLAPASRHKVQQGDRVIYEWDQTLQEVNVYIPVPPGVKAKQIFCEITASHLKFGLVGNPPYMDLDTQQPCVATDSFWTLEDGVLHITLDKQQKGEPWPAAMRGHDLNPAASEEEKRRLLLERYQVEHPGFDFSQAQFSGSAPNARTFMGGMKSA